MPTPTPPLRTTRPTPPRATPPATYTVRAGDSLAAIARRLLGDADRWRELHDANRAVVGNDPGRLRVGMVLKIPRAGQRPAATPPAPKPPKPPRAVTPAPAKPTPAPLKPPAPVAPTPTPKPATGREGDRDGDGVADRYDAAPDDAKDRRWSKLATDAFRDFVGRHTVKLALEGVEIDCADLAMKLLHDFCQATGLPNPVGKAAENWQVYTPKRTGGLPNVMGTNYFLPGLSADQIAKQHTRRVNDADGNGVAGWDAKTGQVDVADLRAGDILFYDWEGDGEVNHTVNVLAVHPDGTVVLGWGTYDNLGGEGTKLAWKNLDLAPIEAAILKPGTEAYQKWLGPDNKLWGARRFGWLADKEASPSVAYVPYVAPPPPPLPAPDAPPGPVGPGTPTS